MKTIQRICALLKDDEPLNAALIQMRHKITYQKAKQVIEYYKQQKIKKTIIDKWKGQN